MIQSAFVTMCLLCAHAATDSHAPTIEADPPADEHGTARSENGYYQLRWKVKDAGDSTVYTLEESPSPAFDNAKEAYQGPDAATTFSGRPDGVWYYRVKADDGSWSDTLEVVVQHHSLAEAFTYLAAGAVVFLATAALVITGHIRHRREGPHY